MAGGKVVLVKPGRGLTKKQKKETRRIVDSRLKPGIELKYYDDAVSLSLTNQWGWRQLILPTQGQSDAGQRDGDKMLPVRMEIRGDIVGADSTNMMRIVIFRVKTGTSANNYFSIGSGAANAYTPYSPYSHDGRKAIEVLYDKSFGTSSTGTDHHVLVKTLKLARKPIQFSGGTTDYRINGLYMAYCSDSGAATHPTFTYNIRTFYQDS